MRGDAVTEQVGAVRAYEWQRDTEGAPKIYARDNNRLLLVSTLVSKVSLFISSDIEPVRDSPVILTHDSRR
jgi:hypothetical protein